MTEPDATLVDRALEYAASHAPGLIEDAGLIDGAGPIDQCGLVDLREAFAYAESPAGRVASATARVEVFGDSIARQTAELWSAVREVLDDAERHPELFVDGRVRLTPADARDCAVRAAVADLAVRMRISETAVRTMGESSRRLALCPSTWTAFRAGRVSVANARCVAEACGSIPEERLAAFDHLIADAATTLAPGRFRRAVARARDRVHPLPVAERHAEAATARRVVLEHGLDGMSWLSLHLPSVVAEHAHGRLDAIARDLAGARGESRTLDQLRADAAGDLLTSGTGTSGAGAGTAGAGGPTVHLTVTVPAETLAGGDRPGVLDGLGTISASAARDLAVRATSFARAAVDPITEATVVVDPRRYRLSETLIRRIRARDRVCRFPGCLRAARACDIDHVAEWQHGGESRPDNLTCLCRHHHRLKSVTRWRSDPPDPYTATVRWTSPTGAATDSDPPPF